MLSEIDLDDLVGRIVATTIDKTLEKLDVKFSIYGRSLVVTANGKKHDISKTIPESVWDLGGEVKNPIDDWKIREMLCLVVRDFVKGKYPLTDVGKIIM